MKSPKKGGQHVNTTSSGVRAIYEPLGISAICYDERSQHQNKQIALKRLYKKIEANGKNKNDTLKMHCWKNAKVIERGNPTKIFKSSKFIELLPKFNPDKAVPRVYNKAI